MTTAVTKEKKDARTTTGLAHDPWQTLGFPSLTRMRREFDDLWGKFFHEMPALWAAERADARWAFDVEDQPEAYVIKAEAPGFELADFNIELRGEQLVLQARKTEQKQDDKEESFMATEFYHAMTIPPHVDARHVTATYKRGLLEVSLPKTEAGKGRKIAVKGE